MAQQLLVGQGLLIIEASRSHSGTKSSFGLPWRSDQPEAETYAGHHTTHNRQISTPPVGFKHTIPASERQQNCALDRTATGKHNISVPTAE